MSSLSNPLAVVIGRCRKPCVCSNRSCSVLTCPFISPERLKLYKPVQLIENRRAQRLAASLAGAVALLIGSGVLASPAGAATATAVEHVCTEVGTPGQYADQYGNTAYVCTDLMSWDDGDGTYYAAVRTEAWCENTHGVTEQCANIEVSNETAYQNSTGTHVSQVLTQQCGHGAYGPCPATTRWFYGGDGVPDTVVTCLANTWGVTVLDDPSQGYYTRIELPSSGKVVTLSANLGTPHTSVGNC